jgi:NhaP-type Na+/H+ or K+/H+ antiporter
MRRPRQEDVMLWSMIVGISSLAVAVIASVMGHLDGFRWIALISWLVFVVSFISFMTALCTPEPFTRNRRKIRRLRRKGKRPARRRERHETRAS